MKNKVTIIFPIIAIIILLLLTVTTIKRKNNFSYENDNMQTEYKENDFNIDLIKTVNNNNQRNYLISPYSIEIALNMLKIGANGNTLKEIEKVIGNRNIIDISIKDKISIANAAFIKTEYQNMVLDKYYNRLKEDYHSEILYDEFKSPKVINDWVNNKTNGMIDKLLDDIDDYFVMGLANALAIDVEWNSPFECQKTTSEKFTKKDNTTIQVEMMHKELNNTSYLKNDDATGIIIPYKSYNSITGDIDYDNGKKLEFIGILPNDNIDNYINNLNKEKLNNLINSAESLKENTSINLSLPRFKYDYEIEDFIETLKELGIREAFDKENADFSNIIPKSITSLYVGEAIHKTHIDLNENGTKAAAVTYFGMFKNTSIEPKEKEIINIEFNKPFIYIIRDPKTNEMLFFGVVYEPNKWEGSTCTNEG